MQPNVCTVKKLKDDVMQPGSSSGDTSSPPNRKNTLPPGLVEALWPALQVGALSGMGGTLVGAYGGILRSTTPVLFALASGIQWFTLGTTFTASRGMILQAWGGEKVPSREKISASAIAGAAGGAMGGLLRGRANIMPGAVVFAAFGAAGQALYNRADSQRSMAEDSSPRDLKTSWINSKWSPMKVLSDREYEDLLQEKLLRVNADIALIDESIEVLRAREREMAAKSSSEPGNGASTKSTGKK